jgi:hypothetical protein
MVKSTTLIYEDVPRYDSWMRPLVSGFIMLFLILGLVFLNFTTELAITMFILAGFMVLLFAAIIPRRLQIYEDRLRIKLGGPFAFNIPLKSIREARHGSSADILFYWGIKFGTSTSNVIEIIRSEGMNVIITPAHFTKFLTQLNQAVQPEPEDSAV